MSIQNACLPLSYRPSFWFTLLTSPTSLCLLGVNPTTSAILGCISARLAPSSFDSLSSTPTVHILSLAVAPTARRTGLASTLITEVLLALLATVGGGKGRRKVQVTLHVLASNTGAQALYRRVGLVEVARKRGYYRRLQGGGDGEAVEMRGMMEV